MQHKRTTSPRLENVLRKFPSTEGLSYVGAWSVRIEGYVARFDEIFSQGDLKTPRRNGLDSLIRWIVGYISSRRANNLAPRVYDNIT